MSRPLGRGLSLSYAARNLVVREEVVSRYP